MPLFEHKMKEYQLTNSEPIVKYSSFSVSRFGFKYNFGVSLLGSAILPGTNIQIKIKFEDFYSQLLGVTLALQQNILITLQTPLNSELQIINSTSQQISKVFFSIDSWISKIHFNSEDGEDDILFLNLFVPISIPPSISSKSVMVNYSLNVGLVSEKGEVASIEFPIIITGLPESLLPLKSIDDPESEDALVNLIKGRLSNNND
eukprot:TRINITY_DN4117_c0_g2_i2.p1 TRINITY_DN4117_c0_g2~~TRINITY_DN4117_c0_g2_i2.p1  ORF type:complete len:204 (+),score=53.49 TRINITY_DN4117_c0_g2_i2:124-735(+)